MIEEEIAAKNIGKDTAEKKGKKTSSVNADEIATLMKSKEIFFFTTSDEIVASHLESLGYTRIKSGGFEC